MNESLGIRFFEILPEEAQLVRRTTASWKGMSREWRSAFRGAMFRGAIDRFLGERGCRIVDNLNEAEEEEQIRILCSQLSDERRRKL